MPFRLAKGGAASIRADIKWDASKGRRHIHNQVEDAAASGQLFIRGRIIDRVEAISSVKFTRYWDTDTEYLETLVNR